MYVSSKQDMIIQNGFAHQNNVGIYDIKKYKYFYKEFLQFIKSLIFMMINSLKLSQKIKIEGLIQINDYQYDYYGNRLACTDSEGNIVIYQKDNQNKFKKHSSFKGADAAIWKVSWAHPRFGDLIAVASFSKKVAIYQLRNQWVEIAYHYLHQASVNQVKWAPYYFGLKLYACSSDGKFSLLQLKGNNWIARAFSAHELSINSLAIQRKCILDQLDNYERQYPQIITASKDKTISLWVYHEQNYVKKLVYVAHKEAVRSIIWRQPAAIEQQFQIFTCSEDGTVKIIRFNSDKIEEFKILEVNYPILKLAQSRLGNILVASVKQHQIGKSHILKEFSDRNWKQIENIKE